MRFIKNNRGMTLAEVVVAATIITVFMGALVGLYTLHMKVIFQAPSLVKAAFLGEETLEAVKFLRNISWNANIASLTLGTDYYLIWQNGKWEPTNTNTYIDGSYERKFRLEAVGRDAGSNIIASGGTVDPNTLKLVATISWSERAATTTKVFTTYVANLYDN